jgi:preprotein translocase subunit YajC
MDVLSTILQGTALAHLPLGFAPNPDGGGGNPIMGLLPLLMVMVIFFLLIIRPQQKRQKQHQKMLGELKRGDRVLTNGGMFATIVDVKDEFFVATIADGVKVEIARNAVAGKSEKKS